MQRAKLIGIAPQLVVKDVVKTAEYYKAVFGFNLIDYFMKPPVYAMVERDGFQIHFAKSASEHIKKNADFRKISHDLVIWVPEIDSFYEELKSQNASIVEETSRRVYPNREFMVQDGDAHRILICD